MVQSALLIAWMSGGSLAAALRTEPGQPRLQWLPVALILGPLWLAVAGEQRSARSSIPSTAPARRR